MRAGRCCSTLGQAAARRHLSTQQATPAWPPVAIIGVGQLGAAVASNLLRNEVDVTLFDLAGDANVPLPLAGQLNGAKWAASAREAAQQAEVVITALPRPEHVSAAFAGDDGILAGLQPGTVWIEHSTTDFHNTDRIRQSVEEAGGHAVEAPLTGGMQILRAGKMVTLVGAEEEVFEGRIASLVALSAPRIVRCGTFGHATIVKIFSNILCAAHDVAIGETLCLAKKAGLDLRLVFDAMRVSSGNSFCWETEVPRMLKGDYYPDFTAEMMHKDIQLGLALGDQFHVPMPMNSFIAERYEQAMEKYGKGSGSGIPCRLVEHESGVRLGDQDASADDGCSPGGYPGNSVDDESHGGAFRDWSYTTEVTDGSYTIVHTGYDNCYLQDPFTLHHAGRRTVDASRASAGSGKETDAVVELEMLRARVAELEAELGRR